MSESIYPTGIAQKLHELEKAVWGLARLLEEEHTDQSTEEFVRVGRIINEFVDYQIEWLTSHNDIEFCKEEEDLIVRFLKDTASCFLLERGEKR